MSSSGFKEAVVSPVRAPTGRRLPHFMALTATTTITTASTAASIYITIPLTTSDTTLTTITSSAQKVRLISLGFVTLSPRHIH